MTTTPQLGVTPQAAMNPLTISILLLVCAALITLAYVVVDEQA